MEQFEKDKKKAFGRAMGLTVALIAGIPLIIVGAIMLGRGQKAVGGVLLGFGVLGAVTGFYGSPLAWTALGDFSRISRLLSLINNDYVYSMQDLAKQMKLPKIQVEKLVDKSMTRGYLKGFLFEGDTLKLNQNVKQAPTEHSVVCPFCGALVNFSGPQTICPYCQAIVKYAPADADAANKQ